MAGTHSYSTTGIVARGRIYVAADNKVYAFKLPGGTPTPTPTPTATYTHRDCHRTTPTCYAHRNCHGHTKSYSDANCHCNVHTDPDCHPW